MASTACLPRPALILLCLGLLLAALLAPGTARAAPADVQTTWRLLDYIAVDYSEAVAGGRVVNQFEYDEMLEFSRSVRTRTAALPAGPQRAGLERSAAGLERLVLAKAPPPQVAESARRLAGSLLVAYPVPLAPAATPDLSRGAALFAQNCASCHGAAGQGPPAALLELDPPPIDFRDRERARQRSPFGLYQVIGQGLEGTTMPSFASFSDEDRWALAFHAGRIAFPAAAEGRRIWESDPAVRAQVPNMTALSGLTPSALAAKIGPVRADAVIAYLRANPAALEAQVSGASLSLVRERLEASRAAAARGDRRSAEELALSAYLDGFEPVEGILATRDGSLMREIERALGEYRAAVERGESADRLGARSAALAPLLGRAEAALAPEAGTGLSTFLGAFAILLREGLEALLVVIAMIAFLRKAERPEVLPYVHGGWIAALAAGIATWFAATRLITISGASRELTEGVGALLAAAILLSVGIWMHGKSHADEWRRYIAATMSRALTRKSAWFLFGLAFIVVYREVFETILFYAALWTRDNGGTIVAGALTATILLAGIAWAMLRYSRKLPMTLFFRYSAILIAVLAVVLAGKGIGALQEAGVAPITLLEGAPRLPEFGIFPTIEALAAQLITLAAVLLGFRRRSPRPVEPTAAAAE